jgi:hypothetical protein
MTYRSAAFLLLPAALTAALAGCATAFDEGDDLLPATELPTCAPGEASLSGTVDGVKIEAPAARVVGRDFADANGHGIAGHLDVSLDTGDHITITWDDPVRDGAAAAATGVLDGPSASYETCVHDVLPGLVQIDPITGTIHFALSGLARDGLCDGKIDDGDLVGCVGAPVGVPLAD